MNQKRVWSIVNSIFKQKDEGKLVPIYYNKVRRIVFNETAKLTYEEKMLIVGKELSNYHKNNSTNKLYEIINNWDFNNGKISIRNISKFNKISKVTVQKYYAEFKDQIEDMNTNYCNSIGRKNRSKKNEPAVIEDIMTNDDFDFLVVKLKSHEDQLEIYNIIKSYYNDNKINDDEQEKLFELFC